MSDRARVQRPAVATMGPQAIEREIVEDAAAFYATPVQRYIRMMLRLVDAGYASNVEAAHLKVGAAVQAATGSPLRTNLDSIR